MTHRIKSLPKHDAFHKALTNLCFERVGSGPTQLSNLEVIAILCNLRGQILGLCACNQHAIESAIEACVRNISRGIADVHKNGASKPNA